MSNIFGRTEEVFGASYDKGHFVGHGAGGGGDWNLFPQLRSLNRGWSEEGKALQEDVGIRGGALTHLLPDTLQFWGIAITTWITSHEETESP